MKPHPVEAHLVSSHMRTSKSLFVAAVLLASLLVGALQNKAEAANASGEYTGLAPQRVLDTRDGTGRRGVVGPLGPASTINIQLAGVAGIPASDVVAVVLNVTVTQPTAGSWLTIWP